MDAASAADGSDDVPKPGDLSICINCGAPYQLAIVGWVPLDTAALAKLHPKEQRNLAVAQRARVLAEIPDLTKRRGGNA